MIGILGGTFDPVHNGHVQIMAQVIDHLNLTELRLIPCRANALKRYPPQASMSQRLTMLHLATNKLSRTTIDDRELCRKQDSYTIDTLNEIYQELKHKNGRNHPPSLCLCVSSDVFMNLDTWHEWRNILDLTHIVILPRPGQPYHPHSDLQKWLLKHLITDAKLLQCHISGHIFVLKIQHQEIISSSVIRHAITLGREVKHQLPYPVWRYIQEHQLYL